MNGASLYYTDWLTQELPNQMDPEFAVKFVPTVETANKIAASALALNVIV